MSVQRVSSYQSRWIRWGIFIGTLVLPLISVVVVLAATTVTVTDEVYGNNNTGRISAVALNNQWVTDTRSAGYGCFYQIENFSGFQDTGQGATNAEISGTLGSGTVITISNRNMTNINDPSDMGELGGAVSVGSSLAGSLQDGAPMPDPDPGSDGGTNGWYRVNDGSSWEYWNENSGAATNRNAVLFEFGSPVHAFGAFFGDVETRTDNGTPAEIRYKIHDGSVVTQTIPTSTADQSLCGDNFDGCGNQATRWIGVRDDASAGDLGFDWVMVIVGDDDAGGDGNTEHISWVGATIAESCTTPTAVTLSSFKAKNGLESTLLPGLVALFLVLVIGTFVVGRENQES